MIIALTKRGVTFILEGSRLRFSGPRGAIQDDELVWLKENRADVIAKLRQQRKGHKMLSPLSAGQQSLWMSERLTRCSSVNNLPSAVRVMLPVRREVYTEILQVLLDRHDMLRATYHIGEEGELYQAVVGAVESQVIVYDVKGISGQELVAAIEAERERPFALDQEPPIRLALFETSQSDHILLLVVHHLSSDGHTMVVLMLEAIEMLVSLVTGQSFTLPRISARYTDYVDRQNALMTTPAGEDMWTYWKDELAALPAELDLKADFERDPDDTFAVATHDIDFDHAVLSKLESMGKDLGVTKFSLYLTLFQIFLARRSGQTDVVIGTAFSDRPADSNNVAGDYINALPMRARLNWGMTIREVLALQKIKLQEVMEVQSFPVQRIIERLRPDRGGAASPLFNCFFTFGNVQMIGDFNALLGGIGDPVFYKGVELRPVQIVRQQSQFDLALTIGHTKSGSIGHFDYSPNRFKAATIDQLAKEYLEFLTSCADNPDQTLLGEAQRRRVLVDFNPAPVTFDERPFIVQFEEKASSFMDRQALLFGEQSMTYGELLDRTRVLARQLRAAGAGRGVVVGIFMQRSAEMLIGLLAVQMSGSTYLPLDPAFPSERLRFMASDSGLEFLLSDQGMPEWVPQGVRLVGQLVAASDGHDEAIFPERIASQDLCYILYTSGSTGTPNGVAVSHLSLSNFLASMLCEPGIAPDDIFTAITTISFDIAALELFAPLLVGATIDLLASDISGNAEAIRDRCMQTGSQLLQATPTVWRQIIATGWTPTPKFRAFSAGEPLPADLAEQLLTYKTALWNLYGPTETTIHSTVARIVNASDIDVGKPIANTRIYVLDEHGHLVPPGVEGHIWIGGVGLAVGYHNRPDLNGERFRQDPFSKDPAARIYRTGDKGWWRSDGRLVHLGRSDDQIKLRGFRIEPAEIERVLARRSDVQSAIVVPRSAGSDIRLVAFLVMAPESHVISSDMRRHVREYLPEYMVPAIFCELTELPITPNGKIDKRRLPNPFINMVLPTTSGKLEGEVEHKIAAIWREVLGIDGIGPDDNFFELGGHSLLAIKVATLVDRRIGRQLAPESLFFHSLREIAQSLHLIETSKLGFGSLRRAFRVARARSTHAPSSLR